MSTGDGNLYTGEDQTDIADSGELDTTQYGSTFGNYDTNYVYGPGSGWGRDTLSNQNLSNDTNTLSSNSNFDINKVGDWFSKLLTGQGSVADYGTVLTGLMGLYEYMNRDRSPKSWEGKVQKGTYVPPTVSPEYTKNVVSRGYGKPAMGMNPFTGGRYIAPPAVSIPLAKGGALPPRYLRGETDGMADKLPSSIDGQQPAKLSHGEFVIPADVVSHLGNGNSDAGAKVLYKMMDRVRQARTGTKRQGKQIKPEKFMPGGIANIPRYAGGGAVAFNNGGTATAGTTAGGLAPWVGDYVAGSEGFLSKAWALGDQPYQAYQGPLTAGVSPLQEQAFTMAQNLGTPNQFGTATQMATQAGQAAGATSFTPGTFNTGLGPVGSVQSYMSPYMQSVVDIQAREARRQADIGRQSEQARLAQAGAYGGSRQAIMEAERQRNLGQQIGDIQEKGLQSAYDRAMEQRFKEAGLGMDAQRAGEQSRQFGAGLGLQGLQQQLSAAQTLGGLGQQAFGTQLQGLDALSRAGATQQQAEQATVDAQLRQFQEAQQWPYKQLEFQRGLLSGLPVGTQTVTPTTSGFSDLIGGIGDLLGLYKDIKAVG